MYEIDNYSYEILKYFHQLWIYHWFNNLILGDKEIAH